VKTPALVAGGRAQVEDELARAYVIEKAGSTPAMRQYPLSGDRMVALNPIAAPTKRAAVSRMAAAAVGVVAAVALTALAGCTAVSPEPVPPAPTLPIVRTPVSSPTGVDNRALTSEDAYDQCWAAYASTQSPAPPRSEIGDQSFSSNANGLQVTMKLPAKAIAIQCEASPGGSDGTGVLDSMNVLN
jgi:hypothetical protein